MEFAFLDDVIENLYTSEVAQGKISTAFSIISVIIAWSENFAYKVPLSPMILIVVRCGVTFSRHYRVQCIPCTMENPVKALTTEWSGNNIENKLPVCPIFFLPDTHVADESRF